MAHIKEYKTNGNNGSEWPRFLCMVQKRRKKIRVRTLEMQKYSLTKSEQHDTMIIHTVILCLFMDFASNMVILPQDGDNVKHQVE